MTDGENLTQFLMTCPRTAAHEETELLTVLKIPFRVRTPSTFSSEQVAQLQTLAAARKDWKFAEFVDWLTRTDSRGVLRGWYHVVNRGIERRAIFRGASVRCDSEGVPRSNQSSALSRSLGVKRPKLRHDFLALALRTFDIFLLVLGDCHCDREILVAVLTEIFVEGHTRGSFPYDQ
jgi:hypothetical protein